MAGTGLRVEVDHGVALLTLDRPAVRNALSQDLLRQLRSALVRFDDGAEVEAVVLTGTGSAFSAGVDLAELRSDPDVARTIGPRSTPIVSSQTPLVCAVNGPAYTGGLELVLACHVVIASDRATFADTHARLGLTPGWGMTVRLPEAVGSSRALQMSLTGQPVDAETALAWGLVNEVVPHDHLVERALTIARQICGSDRSAVRALTRISDAGRALHDAAAWDLEAGGFIDPSTVRPPGRDGGRPLPAPPDPDPNQR